jgi:hypothetical protein
MGAGSDDRGIGWIFRSTAANAQVGLSSAYRPAMDIKMNDRDHP